MSDSKARAASTASAGDPLKIDCTTELYFKRLLVTLGGPRFPLSAAYRYSRSISFTNWKETFLRDLAKGIEDLTKELEKSNINNARRNRKGSTMTRKKKKGVLDLDLQAIGWYRSGQILKDVLKSMEKDKKKRGKRWQLEDLFRWFSEVSRFSHLYPHNPS